MRFTRLFAFAAISVAFVCTYLPAEVSASYYDYDDTVLVINDNSATSTTIGNYFLSNRTFPPGNVIHIATQEYETVSDSEFVNNIRTPIENFLVSNNLASTTNYIILTKGVPIKVTDPAMTGGSKAVDSKLTLMLGRYASSMASGTPQVSNPYYNKTARFSSATYGIYIVTRLDGYTISDVEALIDRSSNATTTNAGKFVLDVDANKDGGSYEVWNNYLRAATTTLVNRGYTVTLDETTTYLTGQTGVLGYASWGSNDCCDLNNGIPGNSYVNGAIAETAVSSSARTFTHPPTYGQSLIADLIAEGVSAVKGYVSEPQLGAVAHPDILFDRYTQGYTAADSFYMASPFVNWRDVIIADPKMIIEKEVILPFDISSPIDNAISDTQSPTFSWEESQSYNGISKYQLFVDGVLALDNISSTSTALATLSAGTHTHGMSKRLIVTTTLRRQPQPLP